MPGGDDDKRKQVIVAPEGATLPSDYPDREEFERLGREAAEAFKNPTPEPMGPPPPPEGAAPPDDSVPAQEAGAPVDAPDPRASLPPPESVGEEPERTPRIADQTPRAAEWPLNLGVTGGRVAQIPDEPLAAEPLPAVTGGRVAQIPDEPLAAEPLPAVPEEERPVTRGEMTATVAAAVESERQRQLEQENARLRAELAETKQAALAAALPEPPTPPGALPRLPGLPTMPDRAGAGADMGIAPGPDAPMPTLGREPGPGAGPAAARRAASEQFYGQQAEAQAALQREYGGPLGQAGAGVHGALRGLSLGVSDPIVAGIGAAGVAALTDKTFGDAYAEARADMEKMRQANPWTAGAAELTTGVGAALATGGTSAAAKGVTKLTPAGRVAELGERMAVESTAKALARGAGPAAATARGLAKAGAVEGVIGGAGAALSEATDPATYPDGFSPQKMAETIAQSMSSGALLGGGIGATFGYMAGGLRGMPKKADELLEAFDERPLPDVAGSDVPMGELRQTAEAMGQNREAQTSLDDLRKADTRPKGQKRVHQIRMAEGGQEEMTQKLSRAQQADSKRLMELKAAHDDEAGIGAKKAAGAFDEADDVPLYGERDVQGELQFEDVVPPDLPLSQAAQAQVDGVFDNLGAIVDDFATPQPGQEPLKQAEIGFLGELQAQLADARAKIAADLSQGRLGGAYQRYLEDVKGLLAKKLGTRALRGNLRLNALVSDLMRETSHIGKFADNINSVELPKFYPRSKAVQQAIDKQMASLHGKLDGFVDSFGRDARGVEVISRDPQTFGIVNRLRNAFTDKQAVINKHLSKGKIGEVYHVFDQGVKAAIGKEAQNAKSNYVREFLRHLTIEPMNFLEGKNAAGNKIPHIWDDFVDARDAVKRVLSRLDDISKQTGQFKGAANVKATIDRTAGRIRRVIRKGDMNAWQSKGYLDDLQKRIKMSVDNPRVWDLTSPEALAARAQLAGLLADGETWEALSLAERQFVGNKPWARSISTADDSYWSQYFSTGPERSANDWDNNKQADSEAITGLMRNVGDAAAIRDEQAYRLNLRSMAADAEARQRAWGGEAARERTKEIVDLTRTMEQRLDLMAQANADAVDGAKYLKGEPGLETLMGAAVGAVMGGGTGGMAGAMAGREAKATRTLYRAVAEAQAGTQSTVSKAAKSVLKLGRKTLSAAAAGSEVAASHGARIATAIDRMPNDKEVKKKVEHARALQDPSSPDARLVLQQTAALEKLDPAAAEQLAELEKRRAALVASKAPVDDQYDPSTVRKLARIVLAAYTPEKTIKNLGDGVASKDEVEALQVVWPELYASWENAVTAELSAMGGAKSRRAELLVFQMAGLQAKNFLDAERVRNQQMWANPEPKPEQPKPGALPDKAAQTFSADPERYTTKSDRIMSQ